MKERLHDRDLVRERARLSGDNIDWQEYRRKRNDCNRDIKKEKDEYYKNLFLDLQKDNDSKRIHSVANDLLGWKKDLGPKSFLYQGRVTRSPKDLAEIQLNFY